MKNQKKVIPLAKGHGLWGGTTDSMKNAVKINIFKSHFEFPVALHYNDKLLMKDLKSDLWVSF